LNPVEEWRGQPNKELSNQVFGSLDELTTAIDDAFDRLSIPDVRNYFC
jgi:hypothetical protein